MKKFLILTFFGLLAARVTNNMLSQIEMDEEQK